MKKQRVLITLSFFIFFLPAWGLEIQTNENPIYEQAPKTIKETDNAILQKVGEGDDTIQILHVWGSPREMGKAAGTLLKDEIHDFVGLVMQRMMSEIEGGEELLDKVYQHAKPYIPEEIEEELHGMAEGSGIDFQTLMRVNLIGDASEWHCSLFGAWGKATQSTNSLLQLRALDYEVHAGIQRYPLITIYHPDRRHAFANIGWIGMIGVVSGMSSAQIAVSEIGDDYDKENDSFEAIPFVFLLRQVLQYDNSLEQAIDRICGATRNTSLLYAVGDGKKGEARSLQTSRTLCNVFDPSNLEPMTPAHPRIDDIVYWGMSWDVPAFDKPLHDMLLKHYGSLTGEVTIREILPTVGTGNLQVCIYDLTNMILWTANARAQKEEGPLNAYQRAFVRLDMDELFSQEKPKASK